MERAGEGPCERQRDREEIETAYRKTGTRRAHGGCFPAAASPSTGAAAAAAAAGAADLSDPSRLIKANVDATVDRKLRLFFTVWGCARMPSLSFVNKRALL